jgi:hypothetical protein
MTLDFSVVWRNLEFLVVGGLLGLGRVEKAVAIPGLIAKA